jgi:flagellin
VTNALQRIRELAVQSANDTNSTADRSSLQAEVNQLTSEINRIATQTTFNGQKLIDGTFTAGDPLAIPPVAGNAMTFQIGAYSGESITINMESAKADDLFGVPAVGSPHVDISTQTNADAALTQIDAALSKVDVQRGDLGAIQNRFQSVIASGQATAENVSAARSRILDADFAAETANLSRAQILQQAGTAMLAQANQQPQNVLSLLK